MNRAYRRAFHLLQMLLPAQSFQIILRLLHTFAYSLTYTPLDFVGSLARKGYRHNIRGINAQIRAQNLHKALHQHICFTAAGTGEQRNIAFNRIYRQSLLRCRILTHRSRLPVRRRRSPAAHGKYRVAGNIHRSACSLPMQNRLHKFFLYNPSAIAPFPA